MNPSKHVKILAQLIPQSHKQLLSLMGPYPCLIWLYLVSSFVQDSMSPRPTLMNTKRCIPSQVVLPVFPDFSLLKKRFKGGWECVTLTHDWNFFFCTYVFLSPSAPYAIPLQKSLRYSPTSPPVLFGSGGQIQVCKVRELAVRPRFFFLPPPRRRGGA